MTDGRHPVDSAVFHAAVRRQTNTSVVAHGHHPFGGYTPSAWRHYVRRRALIGALSRLSFDSVADVGCAEGFFTDAIGTHFGVPAIGIDLSDKAVTRAHDRYGLRFAAGNGMRLPLADGAVDLAFCTETVEHVLEPELLISEMVRVARRWVVVTTPISQPGEAHAPDYELNDEGHIHDFTPDAIARLFGPAASIGSFRNNASFALLWAGRRLPGRLHEALYGFDHRWSQLVGGPTRRLKPLRNRDWLVVLPGGGRERSTSEWCCPECRTPVSEGHQRVTCVNGHEFGFAAEGVPDFVDGARPQVRT